LNSVATFELGPRTRATGNGLVVLQAMVRLNGGMEPGVLPPMSAWCAREAT
jgi:hypothetical protein